MNPVASCLLLLTVLVIGCGDGDKPSPGQEERYDVVIAMCDVRLMSVAETCDRTDTSSGDQIYANVIFGAAGGQEVSVRTEVVKGGSVVDEPPPDQVPEGRSWLHVVQIDRATSCEVSDCELLITALVNGDAVATQSFLFVGPG